MSIGYTAESLPLLVLLGIGSIFIIPLLLWALALLGRLLGLSGSRLMLPFLALSLGGGLLALSLALDGSGVVRPAQVIERRETVRVRREGDWRHELQLLLRYTTDGSPLPPLVDPEMARLEALQIGSGFTLVALAPPPAFFDAVGVGDTIELRVLEIGDLFSLIRPATLSTRTVVPWRPLAIGSALAAMGTTLWLLRRTVAGRLTAVVAALFLLLWPLGDAYLGWQQRETATPPLTAQARVRAVTRVTEIEPFASEESSPIAVPQHYDIVQFEFVPRGASAAVIGVDAIDMPAGDPARYPPGRTIDIVYSADTPRAAHIPGHTHRYHLMNVAAIYADWGLYIMFASALIAAIWVASKLLGQRWAAATR